MTSGDVPAPATRVATDEEVRRAARSLAKALAETPEFRAFEETTLRLRSDAVAQQIMRDLMAKQQALQMLTMLNAVPAEDQAELARLRDAFYSQPAVAAQLEAQEDLTGLCKAVTDLLSERIGLSYTTACGPGCC